MDGSSLADDTSGYMHEPNTAQTVNVERKTDPNLTLAINPPVDFCSCLNIPINITPE